MMKSLRLPLIIGLVFFSSNVFAAPGTKIGIVDMQKALQTVNSGKKAKGQLERYLRKKEKEIQTQKKKLEAEVQAFQKGRVGMTPEAQAKKQAELQEKAMSFQKNQYETQNELKKREMELTGPIIEKLRGIINDVASKKGYTVILEKNENNVLFSRAKDEITTEVISIFNKKNKS